MKKTRITYERSGKRVSFETIKDKNYFYSGGIIYMKIFTQDLAHYAITNVNAISIINAGLTFFDSDEIVEPAIRKIKEKESKNEQTIPDFM